MCLGEAQACANNANKVPSTEGIGPWAYSFFFCLMIPPFGSKPRPGAGYDTMTFRAGNRQPTGFHDFGLYEYEITIEPAIMS